MDEQGTDVVDPPVDPNTGLPLDIPPDGPLGDEGNDIGEPGRDDGPLIDPNSRIPRPVQPDLA
jgi:hypothetical protein